MKAQTLFLSLLAPLAASSCVLVATDGSHSSHRHDDHDHGVEWVDYGEDPMTNPAFQAAQMAAGTPGDAHAELAKSVGEYTVQGTYYMGPGTDPAPMQATASIEMVLGGRYLTQVFKTDFMGMPFEGHMLMGYDNLTGEYWHLWVDNMSTGYAAAHGHKNADGSTDLSGMVRDALTPGGRPTRNVSSVNEDGSFTFSMYDTAPDGHEYLMMELVYTRK